MKNYNKKIKMKYTIIVLICFLTSCGSIEKNYKIILDGCEEYQFLGHFMHFLFLKDYSIEEIVELYPLYISNENIKLIESEFSKLDFDLHNAYYFNEIRIKFDDYYCGVYFGESSPPISGKVVH